MARKYPPLAIRDGGVVDKGGGGNCSESALATEDLVVAEG